MQPGIVDMLGQVVRQSPDAVALASRRSEWRYGGLARAIGAASGFIRSQGLQSGDRVALLLRNCPQYVALYYGALARRCVAVPLNAHERASVLARQVQHAGTRLVFGDEASPEWPGLNNLLREEGVQLVGVNARDAEDSLDVFVSAFSAATPDTFPLEDEIPGEALASIIYTSGTTGRPKGVMLSHRNLGANTSSIVSYLGLLASDSVLCALPFHFSYGNSVLHTHLATGARVVIEENLAFPHLTLQRMAEQRVTGFSGVPSMFALLLDRCRVKDFDLSALRMLTQAGGAMPRPMIARVREEIPQASLFVMYGQTEASARLTYLPPERLTDKIGSVGVPIPGVEISVRAQDGTEVEPGVTGEFCARGPNIMAGYWQDPPLTAEVLRDGWLWTGDLGHRDAEGFLYIDGRSVDMIKVGAFRVSPLEVEEAIASLPGVAEVAVTAQPDELLGQAVKAVIVRQSGADLDVLAVKAHCRQALAAYKVPKLVVFTDALPRTSSGKVQRFLLKEVG